MSRENKYDDEAFFKSYSGMPRSVEGLQAAGEWHELKKLLPDFAGKRVLDLGCGFGWHCRYAAEQGAASVVGIDISEKMLEEAAKKTSQANIRYIRMALEDIDFPAGSFDIAISSLALHYVESFPLVAAGVKKCLERGRLFCFFRRASRIYRRRQAGLALWR
jgi:2-polyprenyl-3-methyl-5-hydroxy-6-metoxy-1,4-benzoquinol methylase